MSSVAIRTHSIVHRFVTLNRRIRVLSREIAALIPDNSSVLDVGCGSGEIASEIISQKSGLNYRGIDILVRPNCAIRVEQYDGEHFPAENKSFDYVVFVDVLHHTPDPEALLREAFRVARKGVIIKDHNCNSFFARKVMTFTDWFGNGQFGVRLLFNFWSSKQWRAAWQRLGVAPDVYADDFGLYPKFTRLIFARDMDFIARIPATR